MRCVLYLRSLAAPLFVASAALCVAPAAWASPTDLFGYGARGPAQGNAMVASHAALESPIYNAAAGAMTEVPVVGAGYGAARLTLDIDGRGANLLQPHGGWGGLVVPVRAGPLNLAFGLALYVPDQFLLRLYSTPATQQRFVIWDSQPHRIVSSAALSARWKDVAALGIGATSLGDASGDVSFDLGARPGRLVATSSIDTDLPVRTALIAGLLLTPLDDWSFGARFTDEIGVHVDLGIKANVRVEGTPLSGTTSVPTTGISYFTPREVALGAAWHPRDWRFEGDLVWQQWSRIPSATFDVNVSVKLGVDTPVVNYRATPPGWHDVLSPHLGAERRFDLGSSRAFTARAGYWYAPTPVPESTGLANYADSDRHVLTAGAGFSCADLGVPLGIDVAGQLQLLVRRENHKDDPNSPGGDFSNGGHVIAGMVGLHLELPEGEK